MQELLAVTSICDLILSVIAQNVCLTPFGSTQTGRVCITADATLIRLVRSPDPFTRGS